jgi:hypothetical protein
MWKIDTDKNKMDAIMKPYHYSIISMLQETKGDLKTVEIYNALLDKGHIISRASVINYCKKLARNNLVNFEERNGKGGSHRLYSSKLTWEQILEVMHNNILDKMTAAFPSSEYLNRTVSKLNQ